MDFSGIRSRAEVDAMSGSTFTAGAERLEQVARSLKTQQIEEHQGRSPLQVASSRLMAISPDEMWARQFSSQCIGPVCFKVAPGSDMTLPPLTQAIQSFAPVRQTATMSVPAPVRAAAATAAPKADASPLGPVPMGALIGKPPRRGFLRRLFGGR
jgi:hypothetical protein